MLTNTRLPGAPPKSTRATGGVSTFDPIRCRDPAVPAAAEKCFGEEGHEREPVFQPRLNGQSTTRAEGERFKSPPPARTRAGVPGRAIRQPVSGWSSSAKKTFGSSPVMIVSRCAVFFSTSRLSKLCEAMWARAGTGSTRPRGRGSLPTASCRRGRRLSEVMQLFPAKSPELGRVSRSVR
jgi:hypothetical protein